MKTYYIPLIDSYLTHDEYLSLLYSQPDLFARVLIYIYLMENIGNVINQAIEESLTK
jgi:hypothetical protein